MRYSYGIMNRQKIILYKPQLFLKSNDLLVFPSTDFNKWHSDIKEYIDGLYQIDFIEMEKGKSINITELNLAVGVLNNINEEFENLFDNEKVSDFSYHYVSILDDKYKKQRSSYTSDMRRCDMQIPVINEEMKYKHIMEIVDEANREFSHAFKKIRTCKSSRMKKKDH
jgi:DNA repair ATPase RecN